MAVAALRFPSPSQAGAKGRSYNGNWLTGIDEQFWRGLNGRDTF
jgi:hypothetical protein